MVRSRPGDGEQLHETFQRLSDMGVSEAIVSLKPPHHPDQVLMVAEASSRVR